MSKLYYIIHFKQFVDTYLLPKRRKAAQTKASLLFVQYKSIIVWQALFVILRKIGSEIDSLCYLT